MSRQVQNLTAQAKLRLERARARYSWLDVGISTFKRFSDDDGGNYAAALTYYFFFSIFPLLLFATSLLGYIAFLSPEARRTIINAGLEAAPMLQTALTKGALRQIEENRQELALIGAVLALYSGSGAVVALEHALNRLYHLTDEPKFVEKRLRSLLWLCILGAAAVASVVISATGRFAGTLFQSLAPLATVVDVLFGLAAIAVGVCIFATAFKVLPAREQGWREVLPGAILAAVVFELLKRFGQGFFESGQRSRSATFGAFAAAAGLLVVSYLLAQITLLAAELNAVLRERRLTRTSLQEAQGGSP